MKVFFIAAFALAILSCNQPKQQADKPAEPMQEKLVFPWLIGNWMIDYGETNIYESWKQQDENMLIGEGYVIAGKDTVVREDMRMQRIGNQWVFIAKINEHNPVLFTCTQDSAGMKLLFENPEHDYPQAITYGKGKADELFAVVNGMVKGKAKREDYFYKKY
ncbi:MAG: hypothetical protein EAY81_09885 [Bacteroidetes bacterium]|nr:MAG: hypothetical protein EAY81_09885 [Bacteroidota bacterium]